MSDEYFQAQYAIPSAFSMRLLQLVGASGGVHGLVVDWLGVGIGVEVGEVEGEEVAVGVGLGEGSGVGVGLGVADWLGLAFVAPLSQTNFFPDFMQVYFLP